MTIHFQLGSYDRPRVSLGFFPTPVHRLARLTDRLRADRPGLPEVWLKRDDQSGLASGGNKVRKLEYLLAEALDAGATEVVTGGGLQSNFARQAAAGCAQLGLHCVLGLHPGYLDDPDYVGGGNVLLDDLLGAEVRVYPGLNTVESIAAAAEELAREGRPAHLIPMGGSTAVGSLGYVDAVAELAAQLPDAHPDVIAVAAASCGTVSGIIAGVAALGWDSRVLAMCVDETPETTHAEIVRQLDALATLGVPVSGVDWQLVGHCRGDGYGIPTDGMRAAVRLLARTEGILLDPVYTGKAFAGLLTELTDGALDSAHRVLFWHTGGTPGLFAYRSQLTGS